MTKLSKKRVANLYKQHRSISQASRNSRGSSRKNARPSRKSNRGNKSNILSTIAKSVAGTIAVAGTVAGTLALHRKFFSSDDSAKAMTELKAEFLKNSEDVKRMSATIELQLSAVQSLAGNIFSNIDVIKQSHSSIHTDYERVGQLTTTALHNQSESLTSLGDLIAQFKEHAENVAKENVNLVKASKEESASVLQQFKSMIDHYKPGEDSGKQIISLITNVTKIFEDKTKAMIEATHQQTTSAEKALSDEKKFFEDTLKEMRAHVNKLYEDQKKIYGPDSELTAANKVQIANLASVLKDTSASIAAIEASTSNLTKITTQLTGVARNETENGILKTLADTSKTVKEGIETIAKEHDELNRKHLSLSGENAVINQKHSDLNNQIRFLEELQSRQMQQQQQLQIQQNPDQLALVPDPTSLQLTVQKKIEDRLSIQIDSAFNIIQTSTNNSLNNMMSILRGLQFSLSNATMALQVVPTADDEQKEMSRKPPKGPKIPYDVQPRDQSPAPSSQPFTPQNREAKSMVSGDSQIHMHPPESRTEAEMRNLELLRENERIAAATLGIRGDSSKRFNTAGKFNKRKSKKRGRSKSSSIFNWKNARRLGIGLAGIGSAGLAYKYRNKIKDASISSYGTLKSSVGKGYEYIKKAFEKFIAALRSFSFSGIKNTAVAFVVKLCAALALLPGKMKTFILKLFGFHTPPSPKEEAKIIDVVQADSNIVNIIFDILNGYKGTDEHNINFGPDVIKNIAVVVYGQLLRPATERGVSRSDAVTDILSKFSDMDYAKKKVKKLMEHVEKSVSAALISFGHKYGAEQIIGMLAGSVRENFDVQSAGNFNHFNTTGRSRSADLPPTKSFGSRIKNFGKSPLGQTVISTIGSYGSAYVADKLFKHIAPTHYQHALDKLNDFYNRNELRSSLLEGRGPHRKQINSYFAKARRVLEKEASLPRFQSGSLFDSIKSGASAIGRRASSVASSVGSKLKSALTSDTAKKIATGLGIAAGTALAGYVGGKALEKYRPEDYARLKSKIDEVRDLPDKIKNTYRDVKMVVPHVINTYKNVDKTIDLYNGAKRKAKSAYQTVANTASSVGSTAYSYVPSAEQVKNFATAQLAPKWYKNLKEQVPEDEFQDALDGSEVPSVVPSETPGRLARALSYVPSVSSIGSWLGGRHVPQVTSAGKFKKGYKKKRHQKKGKWQTAKKWAKYIVPGAVALGGAYLGKKYLSGTFKPEEYPKGYGPMTPRHQPGWEGLFKDPSMTKKHYEDYLKQLATDRGIDLLKYGRNVIGETASSVGSSLRKMYRNVKSGLGISESTDKWLKNAVRMVAERAFQTIDNKLPISMKLLFDEAGWSFPKFLADFQRRSYNSSKGMQKLTDAEAMEIFNDAFTNEFINNKDIADILDKGKFNFAEEFKGYYNKATMKHIAERQAKKETEDAKYHVLWEQNKARDELKQTTKEAKRGNPTGIETGMTSAGSFMTKHKRSNSILKRVPLGAKRRSRSKTPVTFNRKLSVHRY